MISVEQPPESTDPALAEYLTRMLQNISSNISLSNKLSPNYVVPKKPDNGKIYYFPNAINDITTPGFWGYSNGAWVRLG